MATHEISYDGDLWVLEVNDCGTEYRELFTHLDELTGVILEIEKAGGLDAWKTLDALAMAAVKQAGKSFPPMASRVMGMAVSRVASVIRDTPNQATE